MRILITNDDGINAPGLKCLRRIAATLSDDLWCVAPETEQSGAGHSLTLTEPLRVRRISARKFAVKGTPTDCVMMAIHELMRDCPPDLMLSGVNRGANMGEDVTYSGTVAAAMEGALLGIPSIALSQSMARGGAPNWRTAETHAPDLVRNLLRAGWPNSVLINLNFPDVKPGAVRGIEVVPQGQRDASSLTIDTRIDARGRQYHWLGFRRDEEASSRQTDLGAIADAAIAVTPLRLDLTDRASLKRLKAALM